MSILIGTNREGQLEKMTICEVAKAMGVCERTVNNWRRQGLRVIKIGRKCWVLVEDLRAFVESHRTKEGT
jgi:hypothetical protein